MPFLLFRCRDMAPVPVLAQAALRSFLPVQPKDLLKKET